MKGADIMSVQKLHAFEKTSIQARHSIKRLEVFMELAGTEEEKRIAQEILDKFHEVRRAIPKQYQDVDLKDKE